MNSALQVYETLRKKKYSRGEPYHKQELRRRLSYFTKNSRPIKLVGFWGVGPKSSSNWADEASCKFLAELDAEVKLNYQPGVAFTFVFSTLHGTHNGIDDGVINAYVDDMKGLFAEFGFRYMALEPLWKKYGISFKKVDQIFSKKAKGWWENIENSGILEEAAKKRNRRLDPRTAAQKYYIMRGLEKEMLEKEFADSIFHTFSDPNFRTVLPEMPTLYFYSWRKGRSDSPWFIT